MARKLGFLAAEAILVTILLLVPRVISDDSVPIPSDKTKVSAWFNENVQPLGSRKDLDANITAAEVKSPKIITVNGAGGGDFKTLQAAFDSIPEQNKERVIVKLASGNYTEKVKLDYRKPYVTLYGDPKNPPNIIYNGNAAKYGTVDSATLILESDYFMGLNFNCINLSPKPDGSPGGQALALRSTGDWSAFYNVKGYGFQDTLCDDKGHHFWKDCYFEGTVDFIFGNAKSIYLNTVFKIIDNGKIANVVTAHARDNPENDVGFSILHCTVEGAGKKSFLGRTWRSHPTVVYAYSDIGDIIDPWGWDNGMKPEFEKTAFFGEYNNKGTGSDLSKRAGYVKKLTDAEVKPFLSLSYISASKWLLPPITL